MNKKAFINPIGIILAYLIFLALFFLKFGEVLNNLAQQGIALNGLVGIEAFLLSNINLWVFLFSLITVIAGVYVTAE
jgi:hypothetical protein